MKILIILILFSGLALADENRNDFNWQTCLNKDDCVEINLDRVHYFKYSKQTPNVVDVVMDLKRGLAPNIKILQCEFPLQEGKNCNEFIEKNK